MASIRAYTDQERIELQRKCVAEHFDLENENPKDIHAIVERTFASSGIYADQVAGGGDRVAGKDGITGFYETIFPVLPGLQMTCTHFYDVPGTCIREGFAIGNHMAEFSGIPASGRRVSFPFAVIYTFGEDPTKLLGERPYWDNSVPMAQMRGEADATTEYVWNEANPYEASAH